MAKRRGNCCTLAFATSTAMPELEIFLVTNTPVTRIGLHRPRRWKQTLFWRGFWKLRGSMESDITSFVGDGYSSVHPTLLQNVPGWGHAIRAPTTHVSAIGAHSRSLYRTTPHTRAATSFI